MLNFIRGLRHRLKMRKYDEYNIAEYFREQGAKIGSNCRIYVRRLSTEPWLIEIGDRVAISEGVAFVTHDGGVHVFRMEVPNLQHYGRIRIGNNCMIGVNAILLPGISIGENCVIGSGSVVTKDIPDNSFAFGVPARVLMPIEKYKERYLEAWKLQEPEGYGKNLDPARLHDVKYVATTLAGQKYLLREHLTKVL